MITNSISTLYSSTFPEPNSKSWHLLIETPLRLHPPPVKFFFAKSCSLCLFWKNLPNSKENEKNSWWRFFWKSCWLTGSVFTAVEAHDMCLPLNHWDHIRRSHWRCPGRPATLLSKSLCHECLPVNFAKFLRISVYRTLRDDCF